MRGSRLFQRHYKRLGKGMWRWIVAVEGQCIASGRAISEDNARFESTLAQRNYLAQHRGQHLKMNLNR